jgi:uncharacterized protein
MGADELRLDAGDPLAREVSQALSTGEVEEVKRLIDEHPGLATARVVSGGNRRGERTLLHVFADFPGCRARPREMVAVLVEAGADLDAPYVGETHSETALHWAASNDDVPLIDALLDAGADLEARGSAIGGGTAIADATAFGQWQAADRLLARGAATNLFESAVMGLDDRIEAELSVSPSTDPEDITEAFWGACHGGRQSTASRLLMRGAELNWVGYDDLTAVDAAERSGANRLAAWLRKRGGRSAAEMAEQPSG